MGELLEFIVLNKAEILNQLIEHINLTLISLSLAVFAGILTGIFLTRYKKFSGIILGIVGILQTIPSLALFGFLLPFLGIGAKPAIVALFLYSLLPIVQNTYTGIKDIDPAIKESAKGMGMSDFQILTKIELPLSSQIIFAGVRTAAVLCIGIATIATYIGAGGLGEFIARGIALNNTNMILAGAIPAALLALSFDFLLGLIQRFSKRFIYISVSMIFIIFFCFSAQIFSMSKSSFVAGFVPEFMERTDGYQGLKEKYKLKFKTRELDAQIMFQALKNKQVDLISGNSTDGRIIAYKFKILKDDKKIFPSYLATPLVNGQTLRRYPELKKICLKIARKINDAQMATLNFRVENNGESPYTVAKDFLNKLGYKTNIKRNGKADIIVGSKNFTEQFILAEIFTLLIENYSDLNVEMKKGLAGTKVCFDGLKKGEIDLYPEYTGTAYFVVLKPKGIKTDLLNDNNKLYSYVKNESKRKFDVDWLSPLGFNNTWALVMRGEDANKSMIKTISDLKEYLIKQKT